MRTRVEFRSDLFPPYEGEEEEINPDLWGQRLAEYLKEKLTDAGLETGDMWSEDWGWCLQLENEAFPLWIGCGHYQEHPDAYLCFVEPSKAVIRRGLRKVDTTTAVQRVVDALGAILNADPQITDVRWWDESEP